MHFMIWCLIFTSWSTNFSKADMALGSCENTNGMSPFNVTGILGRWYVYEVNEIISAILGDCSIFTFSRKSANSSQIRLDVSNRLLDGFFTTTSTLKEVGQTAQFTQTGFLQIETPFYVIRTDYSNYLIVYICTDMFSIAHDRNVMILTRQKHPSDSTINSAENIITQRGLGNPNSFFKINQNGC